MNKQEINLSEDQFNRLSQRLEEVIVNTIYEIEYAEMYKEGQLVRCPFHAINGSVSTAILRVIRTIKSNKWAELDENRFYTTKEHDKIKLVVECEDSRFYDLPSISLYETKKSKHGQDDNQTRSKPNQRADNNN